MKFLLLAMLVVLVMSGCATSNGRSAALTKQLLVQTTKAQTAVSQALDSKDQINNLIKENEYYDSKETRLINSLN